MPTTGNRRRVAALAAGSTLIGLGFAASTGIASQAVEHGTAAATHGPSAARSANGAESSRNERAKAYFDSRELPQREAVQAQAKAVAARSSSDQAYLRSLGAQSLVDIDPLTGTPRQLGRLDGYLTGTSSKPARTVALDFIRSHLSVLGLSAADLSTLSFSRDYVDPAGLHHLSWVQRVQGTPVYGNGLKVSVTRDGRVLDVQGSPVHGLQQLAAKAPSAERVDAAEARTHAAKDVGFRLAGSSAATKVASASKGATATTKWANHDYSTKVWFLTPQGLRPGWSTYVSGSQGGYQHVIDGVNGSVLLRQSTTADDHGDAKVYPYYPGAPQGGTPVEVNLIKRGWLTRKATFLKGQNVIAFADLNDDNAINAGEKTPVPGTKHGAQFTLKPFTTKASDLCSPKFVCTWDPTTPNSWRTNRNADVTNAFYLANKFHDWLQNGPAQFTTAAGNFTGSGGDPVLLNALDGANTAGGLPDGNHIDNANMNTPPDGTPPTMQMYLWHFPGTTDAQDPFVPTSGAFDPSVLYHEFTHGLSNRLVVDATGNSTLGALQGGSMGEAWSDYYAMDFLVRSGLVKDTPAAGEVFEGEYLMAKKAPFRTMAIDCPVGSTAKGCSTALDGTPGGYTYGDVPTIGGSPEVHSSGEVWAQTLWDIRKTLGSTRADQLITRGMSLSTDSPSMLDMRNAIIQADLVGFGGKDVHKLWGIFAQRGMGYFAGSIDSGDAYPGEDFKTPPSPATPTTSLSGTVTDPTTGAPVADALVTITGLGNGHSARTTASGHYSIPNVYPGTYQKVVATGPGYLLDSKVVDTRASSTADFAIRRDWAASSGGGQIADFNGPDYSPQCGPDFAIDTSLGSGWGSTTGNDNGDPTNVFVPKFIVIKLPQAIDVTSFGVDPSATCGDPGSSSTGDYKIETSVDGTAYTPAATGTFTAADRGQLNTVTPTAGTTGVKYVKFTILGNQVPDFATNCPDGAFGGCTFTDLSEVAVFGAPTP